ncbi:hypothetical protein I5467_07500 [Citrobacter sp. FDAARGOS_156]|uniref:hypothetical protein n=1 Tax=Citrobacter sp. FDAARGOS_156 TaxID=1702170 RepID=UPI001901EB93|nr:hypothetical protein [Citrobacter sp. FDAARGOS_156]EIS7446036.1 hypothetical protein [Citrobacter youngae]MBJ9157681.1 hypothetical protein [Citrobacter sp. FDAARGOS_156]
MLPTGKNLSSVLARKPVKCEALRRAQYCAVIWRVGYRRISGKPGVPGEAQCCGGLIPGGIGCWKEKTPARCSV